MYKLELHGVRSWLRIASLGVYVVLRMFWTLTSPAVTSKMVAAL